MRQYQAASLASSSRSFLDRRGMSMIVNRLYTGAGRWPSGRAARIIDLSRLWPVASLLLCVLAGCANRTCRARDIQWGTVTSQHVNSTGANLPAIIKQVGTEQNVPVLDLTARTVQWLDAATAERAFDIVNVVLDEHIRLRRTRASFSSGTRPRARAMATPMNVAVASILQTPSPPVDTGIANGFRSAGHSFGGGTNGRANDRTGVG
jgi:hypothetical protein